MSVHYPPVPVPGRHCRSTHAAIPFTAREREVLGLLAEGMPNKQIAKVLGISVRTVTVHVSNLLRKTGASSRTEAALWALSGRRSGDHQAGWRDNPRAARSQSSA